jgi:hypothetical protein
MFELNIAVSSGKANTADETTHTDECSAVLSCMLPFSPWWSVVDVRLGWVGEGGTALATGLGGLSV